MPDSGTSPWNTFNIPETTLGINAIRLNEKENSWKPLDTGKLISPPGTPNTELQIPKGENLENLLGKVSLEEKPLRNLYERTSTLRFRPDKKDSIFDLITNYPPHLTFSI